MADLHFLLRLGLRTQLTSVAPTVLVNNPYGICTQPWRAGLTSHRASGAGACRPSLCRRWLISIFCYGWACGLSLLLSHLRCSLMTLTGFVPSPGGLG